MKAVYLYTFFFLGSCICYGQGAQTYFDASANHYVNGRTPQAKQMVSEGLQKYPNDAKLKALAEKMKEDKQKEDQQKQEQKNKEQQKEQQQKEQQEKEQQKDQQNKEEKDKKEKKDEQQQSQNQEQKEDEKKEKNENTPQLSEKLQQ